MASTGGTTDDPSTSTSPAAATHQSKSKGTPSRPPVPSQLSSHLPGTTTYLTGHSSAADGAKAVVHSARPASWKPFEGGMMGFNQIYTNRFPADLNGGADVAFHDEIVGGGNMGLATKGGVVCRMVDFGPLYECSKLKLFLSFFLSFFISPFCGVAGFGGAGSYLKGGGGWWLSMVRI